MGEGEERKRKEKRKWLDEERGGKEVERRGCSVRVDEGRNVSRESVCVCVEGGRRENRKGREIDRYRERKKEQTEYPSVASAYF